MDGVAVTGCNGLLSAIVGLWWWRLKMPDSDPAINAWYDAVDDVAWVLNHVVTRKREERCNDEPPRKRARMS